MSSDWNTSENLHSPMRMANHLVVWWLVVAVVDNIKFHLCWHIFGYESLTRAETKIGYRPALPLVKPTQPPSLTICFDLDKFELRQATKQLSSSFTKVLFVDFLPSIECSHASLPVGLYSIPTSFALLTGYFEILGSSTLLHRLGNMLLGAGMCLLFPFIHVSKYTEHFSSQLIGV